MHPIVAAYDFLSRWFGEHMMWGVLIVGVVGGTIAIKLHFDRDR
ncbi:MAG: hypothetical protein ACK4JB_12135 [Reyranella sp.]